MSDEHPPTARAKYLRRLSTELRRDEPARDVQTTTELATIRVGRRAVRLDLCTSASRFGTSIRLTVFAAEPSTPGATRLRQEVHLYDAEVRELVGALEAARGRLPPPPKRHAP